MQNGDDTQIEETKEEADKITRVDKILSELLTEINVLELEREEEILA